MSTIQVDFFKQVQDLFKTYPTKQETAYHATTGLCGEAGELVDAFKKVWIYGKELDRENAIEELGDIRFYLTALVTNVDPTYNWLASMNVVQPKDLRFYTDITSEFRPLESHICAYIFQEASYLDSIVLGACNRPDVYIKPLLEGASKLYILIRALESLIGVSEEEVEHQNLVKLSRGKNARYKDGYSDKAAQERADKS